MLVLRFFLPLVCGLLLSSFAEATEAEKNTRKSPSKEQQRTFLVHICGLIEKEATARSMPAGFLARLLWQESRFNPQAISPKGASGIAQFMPATALERGLKNPFDPVQAIPASADFLTELQARFGNWGLAAAAYNAGPNRVDAWRKKTSGLPVETRNFVSNITGFSVDDWNGTPAPTANFSLKNGVSFLKACSDFPIRVRPPVAIAKVAWQPWGVHLIAHWDRSKALSIYRQIQREQHKILKNVKPMVLVMRRHSFGTRPRYAVRVGKPSEAEAAGLCQRLRRSGGACLVYKTPR